MPNLFDQTPGPRESCWVLWGRHPEYCGDTIFRISGGTVAECRRERDFRVAGNFTDLVILPEGSQP